MRGAQQRTGVNPEVYGIIPADAGSTEYALRLARSVGDHPRGCGEHATTMSAPVVVTGSSPRMRGAPVRWRLVGFGNGIIPADAGSTTMRNAIDGSIKDHPRGCGEHLLAPLG